MKKSNSVYLKTISDALTIYTEKNGLCFTFSDDPLTTEEVCHERGFLLLFLLQAKEDYEEVHRNTYVLSLLGYSERNQFPLIVKPEEDTILDCMPILNSGRNFEVILAHTLHAFISFCSKNSNQRFIPIDPLFDKFKMKFPIV